MKSFFNVSCKHTSLARSWLVGRSLSKCLAGLSILCMIYVCEADWVKHFLHMNRKWDIVVLRLAELGICWRWICFGVKRCDMDQCYAKTENLALGCFTSCSYCNSKSSALVIVLQVKQFDVIMHLNA